MSEIESDRHDQEQPFDLDARLSAYYGPALREQPLSSSSWLRVRSRLGRRRLPWRTILRRRRFRRAAGRSTVPADVQDAFVSIQNAAHLYYPSVLLACAFAAHRREPLARVVTFGKHRIRLVLPSPRERALQRAELQVLVATGLAQYHCLFGRRISYAVILACATASGLLACAGTVAGLLLHFYVSSALLLALPAIVLSLHVIRRRYAMRADTLIVQWLGRSQVCQGLHLMANHSTAINRRRWGQLSLAERIDRICGTSVEVGDERLTLVR